MQDKDIQRAIIGLGNYELASHMLGHRISLQRWSGMSSKDRMNRVNKFVNDSRVGPVNVHRSISSDQRLIVKAALSSKKPSQRKRCKAERSFSIRKNQGFVLNTSM